MQLMSNNNPTDGSSETEPILNESKSVERVDNYSSTFEIRTVGSSDCSIAVEDSQGSEVNENSSLVTSDQPQCRICLDTEGLDCFFCCTWCNHFSMWSRSLLVQYWDPLITDSQGKI